ncbi:MAG: hypothetical protein FWD60_06935 [Candidatus Azobacteroides sp.]|nr:hypothetical protein [Candidatus Azobacteroides sp.]
MKLKFIHTLFLFLFLFGQFAKANMASPIWEGTSSGSAFSSKDIDILSEKIFIRIDTDFQTAKFIVEYNIRSESSGIQIPLLFLAQDFKDSFYVWLDDKKVNIQDIENKYFDNLSFLGFSNSLEKETVIFWEEHSGSYYRINDLKYFEADIEKGVHKIRVEYIAYVWTDNSDWVKKYSFRYSLTPAKYWKSFGNLEIIVEQEGQVRQIVTNLGQPNEKGIKSINTWTFNKLPNEYFEISFKPALNYFAKIIILVSPLGLWIIATILLVLIHLEFTFLYRRKNIAKKFSVVVIIGSITIPFLSLMSFVYSFDLIDIVIGEHASRRHGYIFLVFFLYPIFVLFYWLTFWIVDRKYKKKLLNENASR